MPKRQYLLCVPTKATILLLRVAALRNRVLSMSMVLFVEVIEVVNYAARQPKSIRRIGDPLKRAVLQHCQCLPFLP